MEHTGNVTFHNDRIVAAAAWNIGGRDYMQDAFSIGLNHSVKGQPVDFVGVFDGHGKVGENVSQTVAKYLCKEVLLEYEKTGRFEQSIETVCYDLDDAIRNAPELLNDNGMVTGGSTTCCLWILGGNIYVCNIGDSRCCLSYGELHNAVQVSMDQKPLSPKEKARIEKAGGYVKRKRVNGGLGVARAFGDYKYKDVASLKPWEQKVTVMPDVYTVLLDERINFLLLGSDGVWDVKSCQDAVDGMVEKMGQGLRVDKAAAEVVLSCISPGHDNTTMCVVLLNEFARRERARHPNIRKFNNDKEED